jgi:hypothetical protein
MCNIGESGGVIMSPTKGDHKYWAAELVMVISGLWMQDW